MLILAYFIRYIMLFVNRFAQIIVLYTFYKCIDGRERPITI